MDEEAKPTRTERVKQWVVMKLMLVAHKAHPEFFLHLCGVTISEALREQWEEQVLDSARGALEAAINKELEGQDDEQPEHTQPTMH